MSNAVYIYYIYIIVSSSLSVGVVSCNVILTIDKIYKIYNKHVYIQYTSIYMNILQYIPNSVYTIPKTAIVVHSNAGIVSGGVEGQDGFSIALCKIKREM